MWIHIRTRAWVHDDKVQWQWCHLCTLEDMVLVYLGFIYSPWGYEAMETQRRLDTVMWHMCVSEFMRSLYGGFFTEKKIRIFSVLFSSTPKELVSFESASGVESEYPVNPVQPLGHFGCRAAWKSGMAEKPVKRSVTAGETGCLCSSLLPSAICTM